MIELRTRTVTIWALGALLLSLAFSAQARAGDGASSLARALGPGVDVTAQSEAGSEITFIGTDPGTAIPLRAATPRAAALEAGERFGSRFGLGADADLRVAGLERLRDGRSAAHLEQTIEGVPVLGGELAVGLTAAGDMLSIGGELEPDGGVDTTPAIGADAAATTAIAAVAKSTGVASTALQASSPVLSIYDPRILGGPGIDLPRAVWRLEVTDDASPVTVRNLVLVDADLGNVALSFSEIEDAKNRIVCNAESEPKLVPCTALEAELKEGDDPTAAAPEAALAYTLTGDLYDFYKDHFGRDSIDGGGMPLISTVSYCEEEECPFENAFWDGEQMVYGDGLVTDDVTGHELTHGVNGSESHLFYYYQSGALDEAIADVFGELFDLSTPSFPTAGDKPADRWKIGEDSSIGTIRNMSDPPAFGQPDRTGSEEWFYEPDADLASGDNGGVHENSGVGGKAAFLITDGASLQRPDDQRAGNREGPPDPLRRHHQPADLGERLPGLRQRPAPGLLRPGRRARNHRDRLRTGRKDGAGDRNGNAAAVGGAGPGERLRGRADAGPRLLRRPREPRQRQLGGGVAPLRTPQRLLLPAGAEHGRARRDLCQQRDDEHLGRRRELGDGLRDRDDEKRHRPERTGSCGSPTRTASSPAKATATTAASSNTAPTAALTGRTPGA